MIGFILKQSNLDVTVKKFSVIGKHEFWIVICQATSIGFKLGFVRFSVIGYAEVQVVFHIRCSQVITDLQIS